ncbi:MAG: hypothetical protein MRQ07_05395, partial [Candidatus Midichloria sp.]|nr:hypothetical protein [Candidatus Midichloria sp.]
TDGGEAVNLLGLIKELKLEVQEKPIKLNLNVYFNGHYYDFDELVKKTMIKLIKIFHFWQIAQII